MKKALSLLGFILFFFHYSHSQTANTWEAMAELPAFPGRQGTASFAIGGYGYVCLGTGSGDFVKDLWQYNPGNDSWTQKADFPGIKRVGVNWFVINDKAFVGNGYGNNTYQKDFYSYNPSTNQWAEVAYFPGDFYRYYSCFAVNGKGYLVGGSGLSASHPSFNPNPVWEYDPEENTWTLLDQAFPGPRLTATGTFTIGSKSYICGGLIDGNANLPSKEVWEFDGIEKTWTKMNDFPVAQRDVNGFTILGKGYIVNGQHGYAESGAAIYSEKLFQYDEIGDQWVEKAPFVPGRAQASAFAIDTIAYVFGGSHQAWDDPFFDYGNYQRYISDVCHEPELTIEAPSALCSGDSVVIRVSGASTYRFSAEDEFTEIDTLLIKPLTTTSYIIQGTNNGSCIARRKITVKVSALQISVLSDTTMCDADTVQIAFNGTASVGTTFEWNVGAGSIIGGNTESLINVIWPIRGDHEVSLKASVGACLDSVSVNWHYNPNPTVLIDAPATLCHGDSAVVRLSGADGYRWIDEGDYLPVDSLFIHPDVSTTYTLYSANEETCFASERFFVEVISINASISPDVQVCEDGTSTINFNGSAPENTLYEWTIEGGSNVHESNGDSVVVDWTSHGDHLVSVTASKHGCLDSASTTWNYNTNPHLVVDAPAIICEGESATIILSGADGYRWSVDDEYLPDDIRIVSPNITTPYTVYATNDGTCFSYYSFQIGVTVAGLELTSNEVCGSDYTHVMFAGSQPDGGDLSWSFDGGNVVEVSGGYDVFWTTNGSKEISVTLNHAGCMDEAKANVMVHTRPSSTFSYKSSEVCQFNTISLVRSDSGGVEYTWDPLDATLIEDKGDTLLIKFEEAGSNFVSLTATTTSCISTDSVAFQVARGPIADFSIPETACGLDPLTVEFEGLAYETTNFDWQFDNSASSEGVGSGPMVISWSTFGTKNVSLTLTDNGCESSRSGSVTLKPLPKLLFVKSGNACPDSEYSLTYTGDENATTTWLFDNASVISGSGNGPYALSWASPGLKNIPVTVSLDGCTKDTVLLAQIGSDVSSPEICYVSVDDDSESNRLVWSAAETNSIEKFGIYRESNVINEFELIEYIDYAPSIEFFDAGASPESRSYLYAISAVDTCGIETPIGTPHKTSHLSINEGINGAYNLIWTTYEGRQFSSYRVLRMVGIGEFTIVAEFSGSVSSYTDSEPPAGTSAYQLEMLADFACANPGGRAKELTSIKSNVARASVITATERSEKILISPNPVTNKLVVKGSALKPKAFSMYSSTSILVMSGDFDSESTLDVGHLTAGVYFLTITTEEGEIVKKVLKY
jgi:N-acetylneuraminic acid mutarotase